MDRGHGPVRSVLRANQINTYPEILADPQIAALISVSSFSTPSTWTVDTDRGRTTLVLKSEDDIRRLGDGRLLIHSAQGLNFAIADRTRLGKASRLLLERFL